MEARSEPAKSTRLIVARVSFCCPPKTCFCTTWLELGLGLGLGLGLTLPLPLPYP